MNRPVLTPDPKRAPACFAPPVTDDVLEQYQQLSESAAEPVKEAMTTLIVMVAKFRETPESTLLGVPLDTDMTRSPFGGKAPPKIVPLEQEEVNRMWDYVPWPHELDAMGKLFDGIDGQTQADLRNAAYHLLWYGRELALDREPMTADKLQ